MTMFTRIVNRPLINGHHTFRRIINKQIRSRSLDQLLADVPYLFLFSATWNIHSVFQTNLNPIHASLFTQNKRKYLWKTMALKFCITYKWDQREPNKIAQLCRYENFVRLALCLTCVTNRDLVFTLWHKCRFFSLVKCSNSSQ